MHVQAAIGVPRQLGHIWIGPRPAPHFWINTWKERHPQWAHTLYDNDYLSGRKFRTQAQIDEYLKRGQYAGVADLMRLEILHESGGFIPGSDSICLANTDHLFVRPCAYTIYENEFVRGKLVSPIQAAEPNNPFVDLLIEELSELPPESLEEPWISTGNLFTAKMIEKHAPDIEVFPSHYFIPLHYSGVAHDGDGPIYAIQMFGSTATGYERLGYQKASVIARLANLRAKRAMNKYNRVRLQEARRVRLAAETARLGISMQLNAAASGNSRDKP